MASSGVVGSDRKASAGISTPERLLASAAPYHVAGNSAPGKSPMPPKSLQMVRVPAEPRVAAVAVQERGSKVANILISTLLSRFAPQTLAANWKAFRRCAPRVVPGLPPTGA